MVSIKNGLRPCCHIDDVIAWFILDKSVFGLENDLYLGCVYIVPENSTYLKHNEYDLLLDDVAKIPSECRILLCGDYNARTNVLSDHDDYVSGSDGDLRNLMPTHLGESCHMISVLNEMGRLVRFSRDKAPANRHGSRLIDFCKATDLIILAAGWATTMAWESLLEMIRQDGVLLIKQSAPLLYLTWSISSRY